MRLRRSATLVLLAATLTLAPRPAASGQGFDLGNDAGPATVSPPAGEPVKVSAVLSATAVRPGEQIVLAVVFDIADGWHIQVRKPAKDWLVPTKVEFDGLPEGVTVGDVQWPEAHAIKVDIGEGPETLDFYSGKAVAFFKLSVPSSTAPGWHRFATIVDYQVCDDKSCLAPAQVKVLVQLPVVPAGEDVAPQNPELFAAYSGRPSAGTIDFDVFGLHIPIAESSFLLLLLMAMIGGFLLNLTPCVLPLIPIKVMGLAKVAGNRGRCALLGGVMSAGVVAFWLVLGGAIAFVAGFDSTNQLFQKPVFTVGVGIVIAVMAVGMMGLFAVRLPAAIYFINPTQETVHGSFLFGIMTAILSTPCTAPFMGAAAAWAATQSPGVTLTVFAAIGLGMALPYLVLAAFPQLAHRMPRTGPASELIKQVMGMLMLAAAAYFTGTGIAGMLVTPPDPPTLAYWWFVAFFVAAAGVWLMIRTVQITPSVVRRGVFVTIAMLFVLFGAYLGFKFTDRGPIKWVYYTPQRLAEAEREGKIVVLEFTAQWCLNCHALEQAVLYDERVVELFNSDRVAPIKIDLTGNNEAGNALLLEAGRRSIPLLVVRDKTGQVLLKSDAYTVQQVLDAIHKAIRTSIADEDNEARRG